MEQFSLKIIIVIASGISLIMGFYMLLIHRNSAKVKGPVFWAAGNLMIGVGFLFRLISPENGFWATAAPMLLITTGLYVYLAGIWQFKEKRIIRWIVIGLPALDIFQSLLFFYLFPLNRVRVGLHLLVLIFYSVISIYEMLQLDDSKQYLRHIFRLNAISFTAFLVLLLAGVGIILDRPGYTPAQINNIWIIAFGVAGGIMTALTFGFLSAVNMQLYTELEGQLKSKTKFFAIIAHDLRGPVGTIMNFLNLLNTEKNLKEEEKLMFMENMEVLSQSTFHLLQNLLEWANTSQNLAHFEDELIELNQLVSSNINFFKSLTQMKSIHLEYHNGEAAYISGNAKMIETVIRNLVSNAIKFTPRDGTISITTRNNKNGVRLVVEDTGIGIESKRLTRIFELANSRSSQGTEGETGSGLGLALCKDFVRKNKGTIRVESKLNAGTKVIIDFPSPV
ncbi:sensor histidine kinase KdpD [Prolixibacter sp. SD074]|uniref:sensor histidine kinase n=1 Tax=Prolixibacter sp. SD074 TaxID=2652391 RepID=UPI00188E1DFF|nr:HAMP domain-containing sensor histidine kinase [Prolixibacter sp. SD074]